MTHSKYCIGARSLYKDYIAKLARYIIFGLYSLLTLTVPLAAGSFVCFLKISAGNHRGCGRKFHDVTWSGKQL